MHLDHVVIAVRDLDAAIHTYRTMGFTVVRGGTHANRATHNALIMFADETYLELLAPTGVSSVPGLIDFSILLPAHETGKSGVNVVGFAQRSDDLDADIGRLRETGFTTGEMIPGERQREDGTVVQWKLTLLDGGFAPFVIQDVTPRHWRITDDPALTTHSNRVVGLHSVDIAVHDLETACARYATFAGVTLHEVTNDQPLGLLGVQVVLADGSTRNLKQFEWKDEDDAW
jgi:catechol 2,3-dioxygenase-like lactoylglutathione lyase family enzyme